MDLEKFKINFAHVEPNSHIWNFYVYTKIRYNDY